MTIQTSKPKSHNIKLLPLDWVAKMPAKTAVTTTCTPRMYPSEAQDPHWPKGNMKNNKEAAEKWVILWNYKNPPKLPTYRAWTTRP